MIRQKYISFKAKQSSSVALHAHNQRAGKANWICCVVCYYLLLRHNYHKYVHDTEYHNCKPLVEFDHKHYCYMLDC